MFYKVHPAFEVISKVQFLLLGSLDLLDEKRRDLKNEKRVKFEDSGQLVEQPRSRAEFCLRKDGAGIGEARQRHEDCGPVAPGDAQSTIFEFLRTFNSHQR